MNTVLSFQRKILAPRSSSKKGRPVWGPARNWIYFNIKLNRLTDVHQADYDGRVRTRIGAPSGQKGQQHGRRCLLWKLATPDVWWEEAMAIRFGWDQMRSAFIIYSNFSGVKLETVQLFVRRDIRSSRENDGNSKYRLGRVYWMLLDLLQCW